MTLKQKLFITCVIFSFLFGPIFVLANNYATGTGTLTLKSSVSTSDDSVGIVDLTFTWKINTTSTYFKLYWAIIPKSVDLGDSVWFTVPGFDSKDLDLGSYTADTETVSTATLYVDFNSASAKAYDVQGTDVLIAKVKIRDLYNNRDILIVSKDFIVGVNDSTNWYLYGAFAGLGILTIALFFVIILYFNKSRRMD